MIPLKDNIPTKRFPIITVFLIIANSVAFFYQLTLGLEKGVELIRFYGLVPFELTRVSPYPLSMTLITSMFLHGGFFHIIGNMLYLWIFGNNVEDSMGRFRFLGFYLLSGVVAGLTQTYANPDSRVPMIGASGAVSGVLGAYLVLYPHARVITLVTFGWFIRLIEIPALVVLGFWAIVQFLNGVLTLGVGSGVAWFAHIGGFISGALFIFVFKRPEVRIGLRRRRFYG